MGAQEIYVEQEGMSISEALRSAQEQARDEYGHDYYNGKINNCSLSNDLTYIFDTLKTKKQKSDFIDDRMSRADKGTVYGVCIVQPKQSTRKQTTKVERFPQKGTRKWVTKYVVEDYYSDKQVGKWEDQQTAIKKAREYTERTQKKCSIEIVKELQSGNVRVANITPIIGNTKQGKYIFFGSAPS